LIVVLKFPAYYKRYWVDYALDYCFVQNTYYLPLTTQPAHNYFDLAKHLINVPQNTTYRDEKQIGKLETLKQLFVCLFAGYYQWVHFVLALEALCFYIPVVIWRNLYEVSGVKVRTICETLAQTETMTSAARKSSIENISKFMERCIDMTERVHGRRSCIAGRYVSMLYLFVKFLFAANCIAQFFILQAFLGLDNVWWGATVTHNVINGYEWQDSGHFPRVTMCDYQVYICVLAVVFSNCIYRSEFLVTFTHIQHNVYY
jgi:hypothetical protein